MTAKEELLKFVFDNEFITKPRLKNDFELLVNKVIDEAQQQVKNSNIPAVIKSVCDHPKDQLEGYHDSSIKCNKCNCIIEQFGKRLEKPSKLSML